MNIIELLREAVKNVPILKYGVWVFIGAIVLIAVMARLRVDATLEEVAKFTIVLLVLSLLAFVLSYLVKNQKSKTVEVLITILLSSIVICITLIVVLTGLYIAGIYESEVIEKWFFTYSSSDTNPHINPDGLIHIESSGWIWDDTVKNTKE